MNTRTQLTERTASAIFFSGTTYFVHFLALGFSSFPLQTHLRRVLTPSTASLVASIIPIAACMTYFLFRFAENRGWTRSPQWMLFCTAVVLGCMQLLLGWRMQNASIGNFLVGPLVDVSLCLLMLGCVQSSVMTLLNHIGVSTMGDYAYTVRAAGSAGYMAALLIMGASSATEKQVETYHLFIGAAISVCHASIAFLAWLMLPSECRLHEHRDGFVPTRGNHKAVLSRSEKPGNGSKWDWYGLLLLVWMVGICEMSYGLYAHEFLTSTYGNYGYFVFAFAVAIEISLLISMPFFPRFKRKLLFVGPAGWILLFSGCLLATQGMALFGLFGLALALNCPFQISANEHAHRMNPSVMGIASMTLAQSLGYVTATLISSVVSRYGTGPGLLWLTVLPFAVLALVLAIRKLTRQNASLNIRDFREPSGVSGRRAVSSIQKSSHDFESELGADHASTDAQNIHVIMLDPLPSRVGVMAETSANPGELVRRHAHANS